MSVLSRAAWLFSALLSAVVVCSLLHVHYTGLVPFGVLAAVALVAFARPAWGLAIVAGLVPIAWYAASEFWNGQVAWAEAVTCAAFVGLGADAWRAGRATRVPRALAVPGGVLAAIVAAGIASGLHVLAARTGPGYWSELGTVATHEYLTDHSVVPLHTGLLLLEGLLIFAHGARLGSSRPGALRIVCAALSLGAAAAAACTFLRLARAAARGPAFWSALVDLASRLRWNVHYRDVNAAGSFFAMALLTAAGLAWTSQGARRGTWIACAVAAAGALWLTSSRIALLAVPAAAAAALLLPRAIRSRRQAIAAAAIGICAATALLALAVVLPRRGIQQSSLLAADVRVGLLETSARMIRAYPIYGIGLGAFYQRTAEFSTPELLAKFPAVQNGENAHNNVLQIAAESGVAGGLAFLWTLVAALGVVAWRAIATGDRLPQLVFAALAAFVLTMMAGHPLLVPEPSYAFWLLAGTAAGSALAASPGPPRGRAPAIAAAAALAAIVLTLPLRFSAAMRDADFEHVGIGTSAWHAASDGTRYREAAGGATFYVPPGAFRFSVRPRTEAPVRLEVVVEGRVANVVTLQPDRWNDIVIPARTVQSESRFRRMDLQTVGRERPPLWITKDEPILPR